MRGFAIPASLLWLLAGAAVVCVIGYSGYRMGQNAVLAEWQAQKLADIAAGAARDRDVSDAIKEKEAQRNQAEARAADNERKWREALRDSRRQHVVLASCSSTVVAAVPEATARAAEPGAGGGADAGAAGGVAERPAGAPAGSGVVPRRGAAGDPGIRLHWRFVGLHDGAYTGLDGEPLFADSARYAGDAARADTPSPYGLDDAIEVHGENARALSTCRREYFAALNKIRAAEAAWGKGGR